MRTALTRRLLALGAATLLAAAAPADGPAELLAAARNGDQTTVRRLLEAGVPVDAADRYGTTALLAAADKGHLEVVRELLARGADPDRRESFYGSHALAAALMHGHREVALLLLEKGADDRGGVLAFALQEGDLELARSAVAAGPIDASQLALLAEQAAELPAELREVLSRATSRPDPPPPRYTAEELRRYEGSFEGWDSDARVRVTVAGGRLTVAVNAESPRALEPVAEDRFRSAEGEIGVNFWGRAGLIEGIALLRGEAPPEALRRSVAEPVPGAFKPPATAVETAVAPTVHWPSFRGPDASGIGDGVDTLVEWDLASGEGVLWTADLPGLGNSSPVVWGDRVFVTTAVAEGTEQTIRTGLTGAGDSIEEEVAHVHSWRVLAFDKRTGERLWSTEVGRGAPLTRRHFKATQANSTPATDGRRLVVVFPTAGLACLDLDGEIRWRKDLGGLNAGAFSDPGIQWGFASSPILHGGRAILQVDVHDGPYLAAWDLGSGEQAWRVERDVAPSWSTPVVVAGEKGDELVVNGSTIHAYDPADGRALWSLAPNSELVIAAPVAGGGVVYVSAGYPPVKPIYAVPVGTRGDLEVDPGQGDPRLAWSDGVGGAYMPTPLLYRGLYYVVHHNGRLVAYDAASGTAVLKSRFSRGGVFTASPVAVNGKLYLGTEEGTLYVLAAGPEYRELAVHDFGEPLMATPAVSEGVLYFRTPSKLIAIGRRERGPLPCPGPHGPP